jgi:drug/metabolite transporter (DMT)-like permease
MVVYAGWSSTYLAIRIAVREGNGFPPFWLSGLRVLVAGLVLLAVALIVRNSLRLSRAEWLRLAVAATLMWAGGNGLVTWAEQRAASSFAALLVGSTPIWVALMEAALDRRAPTPLLFGSLITGFVGLAILAGPTLHGGTSADLAALLALIGSPLAWGIGSVIMSRYPMQVGPFASSALQHLVGAVGFAVILLIVREPLPTPAPEAWAAWAYLVVVGSILTFTSFMQALRLLPVNVVFTYTYVNPIGAVLLGWLILHEEITVWTLVGAGLILLGVAGVFRDRRARAAATTVAEVT